MNKIYILKDINIESKKRIGTLGEILNNNFTLKPKKLKIGDSTLFSRYKIILRYTNQHCFDCVEKGLSILEERYKDNLKEKLLVINNDQAIIFNQYRTINESEPISELDKYNQPYICIINEHGGVLFYLLLKEDNLSLIRKLLREN